MGYNKDRKGYETKDGGLIRIHGDDKVRIDLYEGDERKKDNHIRDTLHYDTNTGKGRIDHHNEDKTEKSSTDISCYLTTACMKYFKDNFDDNCYELNKLRWFRDNFVKEEDIKHYYETAPIIVEAINQEKNKENIYNYIYNNVIDYCIKQIEKANYIEAYKKYKESILILEEEFARKALQKRLVKILKLSK